MSPGFVVYSRAQLERLFGVQLEISAKQGIGPDLIKRFRGCREAALQETISTAYPEGHLPLRPEPARPGGWNTFTACRRTPSV